MANIVFIVNSCELSAALVSKEKRSFVFSKLSTFSQFSCAFLG